MKNRQDGSGGARTRLVTRLASLLLFMVLIIVLANINKWIAPLELDSNQIHALQFALALVAIFLNAHYERQNLEWRLREDRKAEVRQQRLNILDHIESWVSEVGSALESIDALVVLGQRDESDGKLMADPEEIKSIEKNLLRLNSRALLVIGRAVEMGAGRVDSDEWELAVKIGIIWTCLDKLSEMLSGGSVPRTMPVTTEVAKAIQMIDRTRMKVLESD